MTDRELLELAAKAAGYAVEWTEIVSSRVAEFKMIKHTRRQAFLLNSAEWNPLEDDGDALRLAVDLGLVADFSRPSAGKPYKQHAIWLDETMSNAELARRAIVCAAAEVGRKMK